VTHNVWLEKHPYLRPVAEFHNAIEVTVASVLLPAMCIPAWDEYVSDFNLGIPLLQSHNVALDFAPFATPILTVIRMLQSKSLPGKLLEEVRGLYADLQKEAGGSNLLVNSLLRKCSFTLKRPGLFHHLGWSVMARSLSDLVNDFGLWRQEEGWLRSYCPTCGALPAMAQLIGFEHGRARLLCCGYCSTHWNYPRAGCPFCGNADDQRLGYLGLEGEAALRIDYCKDCGGYLKTYNGEGREALFLADWTSLHLDIIARDRGLNRFAESLYQL
jgi:FdhE protein